jgi:hypothetical protein
MSDSQQQPDARLQAYLDGQMPDQEREAFAREIAASADLAAQIKLQKRVEESLCRSFKVPEAPAKVDLPQPELVTVKLRSRRRILVAAAFAATAVTVFWVALALHYFGGEAEPNYDPNQPLAAIYQATLAQGFKPKWVCDNAEEFASTFQKRQGQPLLLAALPAGTKMEGLTYVGGLSRYTTTMLARADGKPVMVFVDRTDTDPHPAEPAARTGLHLFRKQLGSLVLYEISPIDHPAVMDYLELADIPPPKL